MHTDPELYVIPITSLLPRICVACCGTIPEKFLCQCCSVSFLECANMPVVVQGKFGLEYLVRLTRHQRYIEGLKLSKHDLVTQIFSDSSDANRDQPTGFLYTVNIDHAGT